MVKGIVVTERDTRLLYDCYLHAILSIQQIRERHYPQCAKCTLLNRLTKLTHEGLLAKHRVGIVLHLGKSQNIGNVYQITTKGIKLLKATYPNDPFRDEPVRLNSHSLAHDLLLTDALSALQRRFPGYKLVPSCVRKNAAEPQEKIPDAVALDANERPIIAIELELSGKSAVRYRDIVLQYKVHSNVDAVLYIVGGRGIRDKIEFQITQQRATGGRRFSTGKFFFCTLKDLLENPMGVSISNGETQLKGEP